MAIADTRDVILSTFALGSCVGVVIYDHEIGIAGLLHIMLPSSSIAAEKSRNQPFLFADTGIEAFVSALKSKGVSLEKASCVIAGGASVMASSDAFKIGEKNGIAAESKLKDLGIAVRHSDLGGFSNRSLHINLLDGSLLIALPNEKKEIKLK